MTDLRAAAQQALEALKSCSGVPHWPALQPTITALKAALAQQEPVTLPCCGYTDASAIKWNRFNGVVQCHNCGQVYAHPPRREWQGLTEEDIWTLAAKHMDTVLGRLHFARAIEAALKEKNHD
jgi:hypothetical protein